MHNGTSYNNKNGYVTSLFLGTKDEVENIIAAKIKIRPSKKVLRSQVIGNFKVFTTNKVSPDGKRLWGLLTYSGKRYSK